MPMAKKPKSRLVHAISIGLLLLGFFGAIIYVIAHFATRFL